MVHDKKDTERMLREGRKRLAWKVACQALLQKNNSNGLQAFTNKDITCHIEVCRSMFTRLL